MIRSRVKLLMLLIIDSFIIFASQIATLILLSQWYQNSLTPLIYLSIFILISWMNGFYRTSISYVGVSAVKQTLSSLIICSIAIFFLGETSRLILFSSLLILIGIVGYRVVVRELMFQQRHTSAFKTLVYGAGSAGVQFAIASMQGDTHNIVGYIDDDETLCNTSIHGRIVYPSRTIEDLIERHGVKIIVLALPSISKLQRKKIIESLIHYQVRVVTIPTYEDLIDGKQDITQTEDISVDDLLGRDTVPPIENHMKSRTYMKTCLVTGAGGSIGSELCHQIAKCNAKHLILLDVSEPSLFNIEQELLRNNFNNITCYLGSVNDSDLIDKVFSENTIDSVFHAAAYKHVPMIEANPMAAIINNVDGTRLILNTAQKYSCESFILISTDKAVRPTNVMGATKRLAEMLCQNAAETNPNKTTISMVRFGNVLGSSGSVIPAFQKQIKLGGPVTLTHPEITRYFMTIPEAAQLVIQAAGMAKNGDLFLLDMGTPVKIYDLAERLIRLSGKSVKKDSSINDLGSIEIKITGLRPGEKLYEELLIDADSLGTEHEKIMRAREKYLSLEKLESGIVELKKALNENNISEFKKILIKLDIGYQPPTLQ